VKNKSENNKKPEINTDHDDLFLLLDFLQEKVKKLDQKEKEFQEFQEKIYDYNFEKQSTLDLFDQINHVQNLLHQKIKEYESLKFQYNSLIKEVSIIYETLDKYKKISIEQNKEILRAIDLIKKKNKLN
tara:strand:- start:208 stop:594 length:387 start_codon:yes stop_codon:yes gene_type:complete